MKISTRIKRESQTTHTVSFSASDLYEKLLPPGTPSDATIRIFMEIPGGADWSNTDLEVDDGRRSLIVEIITTELTETET